MEVTDLELPGLKLISPRVFEDQRGFFAETYNRRDFLAAGLDLEFVQDNHSFSASKGTVRGLHFQAPPAASTKLVRVLSGAALFVALDLRRGSSCYGRHASLSLDGKGLKAIVVPVGFAFGFCTLLDNTALLYKVTCHFDAALDAGVRWNDPVLGIEWPVSEREAVLSERDRGLPLLAELPLYFE